LYLGGKINLLIPGLKTDIVRFQLQLECKLPALLPANYQYPLSAVIYHIIQNANAGFARFLHDTGYGQGFKSFKLFTFSDMITPFKMRGDRMQLLANKAKLNICFYLPDAAENFIKGLFMNQQIYIGDRISGVHFQVSQIEVVAEKLNAQAHQKIILQPMSPVVAGIKNEKGIYTYLNPTEPGFAESLVYNWLQKYKAIFDAEENSPEELKRGLQLKILLFSNPPQSRLITIKGGSPEETKIRGFKKFRLEVAASKELLEIALGAGLGLYNAQGMGSVEIANKNG
jgi:CRISPR-associated endoribonuclease Cas6